MTDSDNLDFEISKKELQKAMELERIHEKRSVKKRASPEPPFCSFCGKGKNEYQKAIAGPNVFICDECIFYCLDILKNEGNDSGSEFT